MSWQGIQGHDAIVERFRRALARGRLASTFLFVGPEGIGKRTFALKLAQSLLCERNRPEALDPCGTCPACLQVRARTHPDLLLVSKPADKSTIPIELLIGPPERRMQEGLCRDIAMRSFAGGRKVAIIDDADDLNIEGANALLKTLEEPPPDALIILVGTTAENQLPTILSRAQIVAFRPLESEVVEGLLVAEGVVDDLQTAQKLARYCSGSLGRARALADEDLWKFRGQLLRELATSPVDSVGLSRQLLAFVDAAGRDAAPRRQRARQLITFAADLYRQLMRALSGCVPPTDEDLRSGVTRLEQATWDEEMAATAVERSLEALTHIDRNVHLATAIESWLDDLARLGDQAIRSRHAAAPR